MDGNIKTKVKLQCVIWLNWIIEKDNFTQVKPQPSNIAFKHIWKGYEKRLHELCNNRTILLFKSEIYGQIRWIGFWFEKREVS